MEPSLTSDAVDFTSPERIDRIISFACKGHVTVFLRDKEESEVLVKGRMEQVETDQGHQLILITGLSERAVRHLYGVTSLFVEFVMTSAKLLFFVEVIQLREQEIRIAYPQVIKSLERRKATRYSSDRDFLPSISIDALPLDGKELEHIGKPYLPHYSNLFKTISILDISLSGVCLYSYFPYVLTFLRVGETVKGVMIHFPMQTPISIQIGVKWIRQVENHTLKDGEKSSSGLMFKIGCEMTSKYPGDLKQAIEFYVRQIQSNKAL